MSRYADIEFYRNIWCGSFDGTDGELDILIDRAEDMLDMSVSNTHMFTLPDRIRNNVTKAVCAQVDCFAANGGVDYFTEHSADSVSLGSFSYSSGSRQGGQSSAAKPLTALCDQSMMYLEPTGLLYRGVRGL